MKNPYEVMFAIAHANCKDLDIEGDNAWRETTAVIDLRYVTGYWEDKTFVLGTCTVVDTRDSTYSVMMPLQEFKKIKDKVCSGMSNMFQVN